MEMLVPLDGSELAERALGLAQSLSTGSGTPLRLVTVVRDDPAFDDAQRYLQAVAATVDPLPAVSVVMSHDPPAETLAGLASADGSSICMATHGRGGLARALLGSVAEALLRISQAPIWLTGPNYTEANNAAIKHIVALTDGSAVSDAIIPEASAWAGRLAAEMTVAMVITPEIAGELAVQGMNEEAHVERLSVRLGGADFDVLHGEDVAGSVAGYVAGKPDTAVALSTHGRTGLARLAMGSVAMQLAHRLPCPMLVYRPHGELKP